MAQGTYYFVCLNREMDDWAIYLNGYRNEYGTSLWFRGGFEACLVERRESFG